ncbi:MAG: chemotaxis protein CheA, partial [Burkholderiales bacterium PBB5]
MSRTMDIDTSFVDEVLPVFISEANEQIASIEQLLLQLEEAPDDRELLDALFRCAHTVKGSAGIFGLDAVVAFTHHVETLLDRLRDGALALTPALSTLLLQCNDQIRLLVQAAGQDTGDGLVDTVDQRAALVAQLQAAAAGQTVAMLDADSAQQPLPLAETLPAIGQQGWKISARFGAETFRNGMCPLTILHYVAGLGELRHIVCDTAAVPPLQTIDAETCHLGFEFNLLGEVHRGEIESAFSFVRDDITLDLQEPGSSAATLAARIDAMPDQPRLGDLLVGVGAITNGQLGQALQHQTALQTQGEAVPPIGEILTSKIGVSPQVVAAALNKQQRARSNASPGTAAVADDNRFIRVHADRLDEVINLLGELVIAGAGAALLARETKHRALVEANTQIGRLIEEIRNGTLKLRMVPIGETFSRFRRVVR